MPFYYLLIFNLLCHNIFLLIEVAKIANKDNKKIFFSEYQKMIL